MSENICFKFDFSIKVTKNSGYPEIEIYLDDELLVPKKKLLGNETISLPLTLQKDRYHKLIINRSNHNEKDQQIVSIENFEVDNINLNKLLNEMYFMPKYPKKWYQEQKNKNIQWPAKQKGWKEWGFNGRWEMQFTTPFYSWLLQNT